MTPAGLLAAPASAAFEAAVAEVAAGEMALLVEPPETGGAGFLVAAARTVTADMVATMLREAAGMPLLALEEERCRALELWALGRPRPGGPPPAMVAIEAAEGVTTGISAADRALTMRIASSPEATAADVAKPGHITAHRVERDDLPRRPDAFAAGAALAAFAGLPGGAALCQAMDAAGQPATGAALDALAERIGARVVSTIEVLDHLLRSEPLVRRVADRPLETTAGPVRAVSYADRLLPGRHLALLPADRDAAAPAPVEVHVQDPLLDAFDAARAGRRAQLDAALARTAKRGGVLLSLAPRTLADGEDGPADGFAASAHDLLAATHHAHVATHVLTDLGVRSLKTRPFSL
ncbi:3,4-dihydroxy-2-butanone-4-phosphate synthase [Conexibacter arvalis]|uniref:3,4-dihydroxy-2-butanone-4-phosphate synthase n=1 Tax=Conexibacter arvalis TaxID=912552 RepID=A0A840IDK8_9ACTN|nr:3,4-dihydroxy-2-butanone-4-phosphate synthase [Conexibacter arvalis]MBB4662154.1 3,4-dihydroxy 2-butanone 4-phosphate synthase/GTP cyclohydrolase II [Conexibacter arvalis]